MSSPEVEKFEITDYDYANEFNTNRSHTRQSKNQAIYGVFSHDQSDDDSDDGGRPSFGKKKSYSSGINFVSGGFKKSAKDEAAEEEEIKKEPDDKELFDIDPLLQEQFGKPKHKPKPRRAAVRNATHTGNQGIADWERHTQGIGSKLLTSMGYKPGHGLGKKGQGISTPVEAKLRVGKGAIGFYGSERTERSLKDFPVKDKEKDDEEQFQAQLKQWKRTETGKQKPSYVVKTADDLVSTSSARKPRTDKHRAQKSNVKVIDMTGKEQKVLSGYHAIASKKAGDIFDEEPGADRKSFDVPELIHNLNLLIDMTEEEIITRDRQLRYEKDMKVNMEHEYQRLDKLCKTESQQINRLDEILSLIELFEERTNPSSLTPLNIDECAEMFTKLQTHYSEEYRAYDLVTLSIAVVFPLVKKYFIGWNPLSHPAFGTDMMSKWKKLLDVDRRHGDNTATHNAYSKLVWDIWMPILRSTVNQWNTRNADALLEVLEAWMPLLPSWMFKNILDQLINPRLQMEVDKWDPLTDTVPIHQWLHPWLPLMGSRLEPLWAPIRHKLASALNKWYANDGSAKIMIKPWASVFSPGHMESFLQRNIVPKLAICLEDEFIINPANQNLELWRSVLSWQDLLSDQTLVGLLDRSFFPKWLDTLTRWLNTNPNFEQVGSWYQGWKTALPERLIKHPTIRERLTTALNLMNNAVSNPGIPVIPPPLIPGPPPSAPIPNLLQQIYGGSIPDMTSVPSPPIPSGPSRKKRPDEPTAPPLSSNLHTFKQLVEMKCAEHDIQFYPISGKTWEAKQVYQCGTQQITIERGVIFMKDMNTWAPVSLKELLHKALD